MCESEILGPIPLQSQVIQIFVTQKPVLRQIFWKFTPYIYNGNRDKNDWIQRKQIESFHKKRAPPKTKNSNLM